MYVWLNEASVYSVCVCVCVCVCACSELVLFSHQLEVVVLLCSVWCWHSGTATYPTPGVQELQRNNPCVMLRC